MNIRIDECSHGRGLKHNRGIDMGVNKEDDDRSGDAWNRNPKRGGIGDFRGTNVIGIGILLVGIAVIALVFTRG